MKNVVFWETWIASLGRPLRLKPTLTIWTKRLVLVSANRGSLSSAPSINLRNMMPDLQGYAGQYTLGSSSPKATGSMFAWCPWLFPHPQQLSSTRSLLPAHLALLPISDPTPLLYWFPMWPTLPPSILIQLGVFDWWLSLLATCSRWFLTCGLFTLKLEAIRSFEMSVHTRSTWRHIPEDGILHSYRCENIKSYIIDKCSDNTKFKCSITQYQMTSTQFINSGNDICYGPLALTWHKGWENGEGYNCLAALSRRSGGWALSIIT
jgi:hypothetical protein